MSYAAYTWSGGPTIVKYLATAPPLLSDRPRTLALQRVAVNMTSLSLAVSVPPLDSMPCDGNLYGPSLVVIAKAEELAIAEHGASRRNEGTTQNKRELAPTAASLRSVHETKMATDV